jgi:hypothetical protein
MSFTFKEIDGGVFILLDVVYNTLYTILQVWRVRAVSCVGGRGCCFVFAIYSF